MLNKPKISVISPVYNVEPYVGRCIESIQNQSFKDWEMILVDDCGKDNSMNVVYQYASNDSRIKYIDSHSNEGPMIAREKGYKASLGDYIVFIDSDDTLPPMALNLLFNAAIKYDAEVVTGEVLLIDEKGEEVLWNEFDKIQVLNKQDVCSKLLKMEFPHNLCGKMFKRHLLFDSRLKTYKHFTNGEDGFLFYQILDIAECFVTINKPIYYYWVNSTSSTHKKLTENMLKGMAMCTKLKYDILSKHLCNIDRDFERELYRGVSNHAKTVPYKKLKSIYENYGIKLNSSIIHLLKLYPMKQAFKYYFKIHLFNFDGNWMHG